MKKTIVSVWLVCFIGAAQNSYAVDSPLTNETIRSLRLVKNPKLSPDGKQIAFEIQESTANGGDSHLWMVFANGRNMRQLTGLSVQKQTNEKNITWSPDGSTILFLSKLDTGSWNLYQLPLLEEEAVQIQICPHHKTFNGSATNASCADALDISDYALSPNGKWIAIVADDPVRAEDQQRKKDKNDAIVVDHEPTRTRLWLYSRASKSLQQVTDQDWNVAAIAWDAQSARLAVISNPPGHANDLGPHNETWIYSLEDLHNPLSVSWAPPTASALTWAPDGKWLAVLAQAEDETPPSVADLYSVSTRKENPAVVNLNRSQFSLTEEQPIWSVDGKGVYEPVYIGTTATMAYFGLNGQNTTVSFRLPMTKQFSTNAKQTGWSFVGEATDQLPEIRYTTQPLTTTQLPALTASNPQWETQQWTPAEIVRWTSFDGKQIEGTLFWPRQIARNTTTPIPLIVHPHGGPTGISLQKFTLLHQLLVAQGWAVFRPNVRGSLGYGVDFVRANKNDLGNGDYKDIMSGVDALLEKYPIDPRRMGVYGYSYGGEMAAFIEGRTDRFAAIVAGAPVINQISEYGTEDDSWYDRWFYGQPWLHIDDAWRQSPLSLVKNAHTPMLLLHGENDEVDPVGQSQEMYRALRQQGVEVQLVLYPRQKHAALDNDISGLPSKEPWHGFDGRERIVGWFQTHFDETFLQVAGKKQARK